MKHLRVSLAIAASAAILMGATSNASAGVDPGAFKVTMDASSKQQMDQQPDCTPSLTEIMTQAMSGATIDVKCSMKMDDTMEMNGTVANTTMASEFGSDAFLSGTLASTCHVIQEMNMGLTIAGSAPKLNSFKGSMFQNCTWKMTFPDPKATTLAGTMEMNGKAGSDDGSVDASGDVTFEMNMTMYITEGTGEYDGYVGTGSFNRSQTISMMGGGGAQAPGGPGGSGTVSQPSGGSSGNQQVSEAQMTAICAAAAISPCDPSAAMSWCQSNMSTCQVAMGAARMSSIAKRFVTKSLAAAGAENAMSMNLVKGAGVARIISPAPPAGLPNAPATVTAKSKISLVATSGAKCTVKSNNGKTLASRTSTSSSAAAALKAKGGYKGVASIQATCSLDGKTFKSNKVKVKL